jgi:uncharacterized cupin superfamily protein
MSTLPTTAEITHKSDSVFVDKKTGTKVNYYIFPEFEIHANEVAPHSQQDWHHHTKIEEVILVHSGELTALTQDSDKKIKEEVLHSGDVIRVGSSVHTFANKGDETVLYSVFRYVPDGTDKHELIKNDKYPDTVEKQ